MANGLCAFAEDLRVNVAMVFTWAARGTRDDFAGAALVGAGVGTTLGLAAAAYPTFTLQKGLFAVGLGACSSAT